MNFKLKKSEILFRGKVFNLQVDQIIYDSGNEGIREVAVHPGGAVMAAINDESKLILVKQFRYPFQKFLIELPAGKLEVNEDPMVCAIRELQEETGYKSNDVVKLGAIATTPGFCTEILHIYLAKNLKPGNHDREEGEYGMEVMELTFKETETMIASGEIIDSKTICGIYMAKNYYNRK